jgi:hypothetical protein
MVFGGDLLDLFEQIEQQVQCALFAVFCTHLHYQTSRSDFNPSSFFVGLIIRLISWKPKMFIVVWEFLAWVNGWAFPKLFGNLGRCFPEEFAQTDEAAFDYRSTWSGFEAEAPSIGA